MTELEHLICCDLHSTTCEPPSELCCEYCTETDHPQHSQRGPCVLSGEFQRILARTKAPSWVGHFGANIPEMN
jgi:hypothetical protein